jgi:hypothetical protein
MLQVPPSHQHVQAAGLSPLESGPGSLYRSKMAELLPLKYLATEAQKAEA